MENFSIDNFVEPEPWSNRRSVLLGLPITILVFSWICVACRFYTRFWIIRSPWWDDLFVLLYALMTTAGSIAICFSVNHGLGQHFLKLTLFQMNDFLKYFYVANATYTSATTFIKLALLFQYLRVFERGTRTYKVCVIVAVFTALWGIAYSYLAWVPCIPVSEFWTVFSDGHCYGFGSKTPSKLLATYETHTAINMALDSIILIIPFQLFWKQGTGFAQRLRLLALFTMGTLVIVFAAWRLVTIIEHEAATKPSTDPTWYIPISILLAVLEVDAAAICASIPIFWPPLSRHLGNIFVTREINIMRELRCNQEDEFELTGTQVDHFESDSELKHTDTERKKGSHYQDPYIIQQVDPFGTLKASVFVESVQHQRRT